MAKKRYINKADVLKATTFRKVDVDIPDWGTVILQQVSAQTAMEIAEFADQILKQGMGENKADYETTLFSISCYAVDEEGQPLFTVDELRGLSLDIITPLGQAVAGMMRSKKEAKDNLKNDQKESLPTTSQ